MIKEDAINFDLNQHLKQLRKECAFVDAKKTIAIDAKDRRNLSKRRDAIMREIVAAVSMLNSIGINEVQK